MKRIFLIALLIVGVISCFIWISPYEQLGAIPASSDTWGGTVLRNRLNNKIYIIHTNGSLQALRSNDSQIPLY